MAFDHIGGAEPSTLTFKLRTVSQTINSSKMHAEVMHLGDQTSSLAIAAVVNGAPPSTAFGLVVRQAGSISAVIDSGLVDVLQGTSPWIVAGDVTASIISAVDLVVSAVSTISGAVVVRSSAADFGATVTQASTVWAVQLSQWSTTHNVSSLAGAVIIRSSAANALGTMYQSTAADLQATVTPASTVWAVQHSGPIVVRSSAADFSATVTPASGSTWNVRAIQSSAADLQATVTQLTSPWVVASQTGSTWATRPVQSSAADLQVTATIGGNLQSSVAPSSNSSGLVVRQVIDGLTTFASTSALASTSVEVGSSAANIRIYVTAYSITSTNQTPAHWGFFSSNAALLWPMTLAAISSGVAGANLAVGAPSYLFRTAASDALNFKTAGSTVAGLQMAVSYFRAP